MKRERKQEKKNSFVFKYKFDRISIFVGTKINKRNGYEAKKMNEIKLNAYRFRMKWSQWAT